MDAVSKDLLINLIKEASVVYTLIEDWCNVYPEDVQTKLMNLPESSCNRYVDLDDVCTVLVAITVDPKGSMCVGEAIKWIFSKAAESVIKL